MTSQEDIDRVLELFAKAIDCDPENVKRLYHVEFNTRKEE